ncbi:MAG: kynureninase [Candidatus Pacebacteria bacterium]|nr:kynureninase [Candidatus Paceibacterota bacterium]
MKLFSPFVLLLVGILIGYFIFHSEDTNSKLIYGNTGLPKNCRAIIKANYEGWYLKEFSAEDALDSINRNCGQFGISWDLN